MKFIDITGQKFGRLTALSVSHRNADHKICWNVVCDCGTRFTVNGKSMKNGNTKSCGCLQREIIGNNARTHGRTGDSIYTIWALMRKRCSETAAPHCKKHYYDRGIRVCERWQVFENFVSDMGERPSPNHSIDRIDNSGNYYPENCRWATAHQQSRNTRRNYMVTYQGETLCFTDWGIKLGIPYVTLKSRRKKGLSIPEILHQGPLPRTSFVSSKK